LAIEPCQYEPIRRRLIARGPDDRQADVGGEDGVVGRFLVDDAHDVLRMQ
jgi:hypothetical protein